MSENSGNLAHGSFVIVDGRIGTPVNDPGPDEDWVVWMGAAEIVQVATVDEWFGEYASPQRNLANALKYVKAQSRVAQAAIALECAMAELRAAEVP